MYFDTSDFFVCKEQTPLLWSHFMSQEIIVQKEAQGISIVFKCGVVIRFWHPWNV